MSGGSFNYLYGAELTEREDDLRRMAEELRGLGFYELAAETLAAIPDVNDGLREVWRAVEWWQSSDSSVRDACAAAEKYERGRKSEDASTDTFRCACGRRTPLARIVAGAA